MKREGSGRIGEDDGGNSFANLVWKQVPWTSMARLRFSFGHCTIALQVAVILRRELRILILYIANVTNISYIVCNCMLQSSWPVRFNTYSYSFKQSPWNFGAETISASFFIDWFPQMRTQTNRLAISAGDCLYCYWIKTRKGLKSLFIFSF